jgi:hypothetical protein
MFCQRFTFPRSFTRAPLTMHRSYRRLNDGARQNFSAILADAIRIRGRLSIHTLASSTSKSWIEILTPNSRLPPSTVTVILVHCKIPNDEIVSHRRSERSLCSPIRDPFITFHLLHSAGLGDASSVRSHSSIRRLSRLFVPSFESSSSRNPSNALYFSLALSRYALCQRPAPLEFAHVPRARCALRYSGRATTLTCGIILTWTFPSLMGHDRGCRNQFR